MCYLWFVGHESASYRDVADRFGITISALHSLITRVTDFIMILAPNIITYPIPAEKEESAMYFLQEKGFPGVIDNAFACLFIFSFKTFYYCFFRFH